MGALPRKLQVYETAEGVAPFDEWLLALRDGVGRTRIRLRLDRLRDGNSGDWKAIGNGVSELRMDFGPGYRIYFAENGVEIVLLLIGGDKRTQTADIRLAQKYWQDFKER